MTRFATMLGTALTAALLCGTALAQPAEKAAPLDKAAVEKIVRDYLLANPEVLVEAMQVLQAREQESAVKAQTAAIADNADALFRSETSPVGGNPKGDVTLVEFFDYACGFCKRANPERDKAVAADGKVRIVFKEFPILGPGSAIAARAALAARGQGKYEPFHEALMDHQGPLNDAAVMKVAESVGLDTERLRKDMESKAITAEIEANKELAQKLGISGTPAFIVGDRLIPGAIDAGAFETLFAAARKGKDGG